MTNYNKKPVNTDDPDYGVMLNCAIRSQLEQKWDEFDVMVCKALHYTIGRRSYMPHLITDYVKRNIDSLGTQTLEVIVQDIEFAEKMHYLGDDHIDAPMWICFKDLVKEEIERRNNK